MATTKTTVKGTCGACFKKFALDANGRVLRHGWREVGGRRVGSYGNVYHSGNCFGCGRLPFEVSPDCTRDFVAEVLLPMALDTGSRIDALALNPPIKYTGCVTIGYGREEREWGAFEVRVLHGEGETRPMRWYTGMGGLPCLGEDLNTRIPAYEALHNVALRELATKREAIALDAGHCLRAIEAWAPAAVSTVEKKAPLVHAIGFSHRNFSACARRIVSHSGAGLRVTENADGVTCPKCIENLARKSAATA